jgi:hypothetical protein
VPDSDVGVGEDPVNRDGSSVEQVVELEEHPQNEVVAALKSNYLGRDELGVELLPAIVVRCPAGPASGAPTGRARRGGAVPAAS